MHPAVLSVDVLDVSGTAENDAGFAKGMDIHKIRLDTAGRKIGRREYHTPQSQQVMDDGSGMQMMNINVPVAMKVHVVVITGSNSSGMPAQSQLAQSST